MKLGDNHYANYKYAIQENGISLTKDGSIKYLNCNEETLLKNYEKKERLSCGANGEVFSALHHESILS